MAYIIIHPNKEVSDNHTIKVVNKCLQKNFKNFTEIISKPDFHIVEKEEKGSIKIEQIKTLQQKLFYTPFDENFQFGIIKEAHLMTQEAQNALLKTLEESNEETVLILTTTNENSVLQTILSRCTRVYPEEKSQAEKKDYSEEYIEEFLENPIYIQLNKIDEIVSEKKTDEFIENLTSFFRKRHSEKIASNQSPEKEREYLEIIIQAKNRIKRNVNVKIALEYTLLKINHN